MEAPPAAAGKSKKGTRIGGKGGKRKLPGGGSGGFAASAKKKRDPLAGAAATALPKPPREKKHPLEKARDARARELYTLDVGANPVARLKDKKLKTRLKQTEGKYQQAALEAARSELLLPQEAGYLEPEGPLEQTWKLSQREVGKLGAWWGLGWSGCWIGSWLTLLACRIDRSKLNSSWLYSIVYSHTLPLTPTTRCASTWTCRRPARCSPWTSPTWGRTLWTLRATGGTCSWAGSGATWR
jgi:hypothetical protein